MIPASYSSIRSWRAVLRTHTVSKSPDEHDTELSSDVMPGQESFFNPDNVVYRREDKIRTAIKDVDVSRLTPIEAMNILYELTKMVEEENNGED